MHCLIIGVGPGLGLSLVKKFGAKGYVVSMFGRNKERLNRFEHDLAKEKIKCVAHQADVSHFEQLANAITTAITHHGDPDVLIYNVAAIHKGDPLVQFPGQFVEDFKANVAGAIQAVQTVAPYMDREGNGTILLTGGMLAHYPSSQYASLTLGKASILTLAYLLHEALGPKNISVASVTIHGHIAQGTPFDPDKIAAVFWDTCQKPITKEWQVEVPFTGIE